MTTVVASTFIHLRILIIVQLSIFSNIIFFLFSANIRFAISSFQKWYLCRALSFRPCLYIYTHVAFIFLSIQFKSKLQHRFLGYSIRFFAIDPWQRTVITIEKYREILRDRIDRIEILNFQNSLIFSSFVIGIVILSLRILIYS